MKRTYIVVLLIGSLASLLMAATQIVPGSEGDIWQNEFFNYERKVLPLSKSLVLDVRICAGLKEKDVLLAAVMTSLHHDAIGNKSPLNRLHYDGLAYAEKELLQYAALFKGGPLSASEESEVKKIFRVIRSDFGKRSSYWKVNGSFFAGMALAMKRDVFGSSKDIRKMLERLEQKNGWGVTFNEYNHPSADVITQALNQKRVPLLLPTGSGIGGGVLVALGAVNSGDSTLLVCCDPTAVSVGKCSLFDQVPYSSHQYHMLQPPGAPGWNLLQWKKTMLADDDFIFKSSVAQLPAGFTIFEYKSDKWKTAIIGDLKVNNEAWKVNVEHVVMSSVEKVESGRWWTDLFKTSSNESKGESQNPFDSASVQQDVVENLACCSTNNLVGQYDAAVITALIAFENGIGSVVSNQSSWCEFLIYAYAEYWAKLSDQQKEEFKKKKEFKPPSFSVYSSLKYGHGENIWGYDEYSASELRKIYKGICLQSSELAVQSSRTSSLLQNIALKIKPLIQESGSFPELVELLTSRYGLESTLEQTEGPAFGFFKKAIEMGMPVLTKCKNGKWIVVTGYKKSDVKEQLLVVDFKELTPDLALADISDAQHRAIMALPEYAPGRKAYLSRLKSESTRFVDIQLNDTEDLPQGISFVEFDAGQYAEAYVVHSWKRTVPDDAKRRINELVERSVKTK